MKERPIIFNTEMVKAILKGQKAQTRRPIKQRNCPIRFSEWLTIYKKDSQFFCKTDDEFGVVDGFKMGNCPYGKVGDRLWVRETFKYQETKDGFHEFIYKDGIRRYLACPKEWLNKNMHFWNWNKWKPSIHMPRWASRTTLEIIDVRVERVRSISNEDCLKEGLRFLAFPETTPEQWNGIYRKGFERLWDSIYGEGAFDKNDWVWVLAYKVVE